MHMSEDVSYWCQMADEEFRDGYNSKTTVKSQDSVPG